MVWMRRKGLDSMWRGGTLSDLSSLQSQSLPATAAATPEDEDKGLSQAARDNIGVLLQKHCIDSQLYLQHDLNVAQLAKAIGTNRFYLSQYFSAQGITYNAYINNLRIDHFKNLYRLALAQGRSFTAQQLAGESGYHSYSTFRLAFKQRMGQNVREWMHETTPNSQD